MTALKLEDYRFLLRHDLMSFAQRAFYELNPQTPLKLAPHLEMIATVLEQVRRGEIKRLIINLPPRHLKSHIVSISFVAYWLGHNPAAQIICVSYGQDLADKLARDCRTLMSSLWYQELFLTTRLAGRAAVSDFFTTQQGFRMATSVGGVLTGRGGDLIVIDDPQKPDEALSEVSRKATKDWYDNTLLSRLNDKETGAIVIIMQRLHQDDLIGHVTEQGDWKILSLPAIATEDQTFLIESPLGRRIYTRKEGEILHPERESAETLAQIRGSIGEYNFLSQYQQNPAPRDGALVKRAWLKYYKQLPKFWRVVVSWDTANKAGELNDFSVGTVWGVYDRHYYLLEVVRCRMNYPELKEAVIALAKKHHANNVVIEDKASGTQLIQELSRTLGSTVTAYKAPTGADKIMRFHTQTDLFQAGRVLLPENAPWLAEYVNEVTGFPGTRYDDQVDSTAQALDHMRLPNTLETWAKLGRQL